MLKQALKLYANTFLAGVMGVFIYVSVGVIFSLSVQGGETMSATAGTWMNIVAFVLQAVLFFIILYSKMWEMGDKTANAVNFGRLAHDPWRGLKIALLAAIPSIVSFLALIADKVFGFWPGMATAYRVFHTALYPVIVWAFGSVLTVTTADISWAGIVCAGLPLLFMPVVATLAYGLGYRHIVLWEKIVFVSKQK